MRAVAFVLRQQAGELFAWAAQLDAEAGRQDE